MRLTVLRDIDTLRLLVLNLLLDPVVRALQTLAQRDAGSPAELLANESVVAVTTTHTFGTRNVVQLGTVFLARVFEGEVRHLVHVHHLLATNVDGLAHIAAHQAQDTLHTVVNVTERTRLLAIAPHLEHVTAHYGLATECCWSLLATTLPSAVRTVDVVEATKAELNAKVLLYQLVE